GADEYPSAGAIEAHHRAFRTRQQAREARPARRGFRRIVGDDVDRLQRRYSVGMGEVLLGPDRLGRELLDVLHAPFGHLRRRDVDDLEAHLVAALERALETDEGIGLEAVLGEAPVLGFGLRRAEAGEVHAVVPRHVIARSAGVRRVERRREDLDVALLQHDAAVGGSGRRALRPVRRFRRHLEPKQLRDARRRAEVRHEVRYVVEVELAWGGALVLGDARHGANIAAARAFGRRLALAFGGVADRVARFLHAACCRLARLVELTAGLFSRAFLVARGERYEREECE